MFHDIICLEDLLPAGDLFANAALEGYVLESFAENLGEQVENLETAQKMYMETMAPGTVSRKKFCHWTAKKYPAVILQHMSYFLLIIL